jgi:hypothetical protein
MVEQATHASRVLADEATALEHRIAQFRVSNSEAPRAASLGVA